MTTNSLRRLTPLIMAGLLVVGATACSREPELPPLGNAADEPAPHDTATPDAAPPTPMATPTTETMANATAPAAAPVAPDEQMLDDATATGMTSRSSRGDDSGDTPAPAPGNQQ